MSKPKMLCRDLVPHAPHPWGGPGNLKRLDWVYECPGLAEPRDLIPVKDRRPHYPGEICKVCATWVCTTCWNYRVITSRHPDDARFQRCKNCGHTEGRYYAVKHRRPQHGTR